MRTGFMKLTIKIARPDVKLAVETLRPHRGALPRHFKILYENSTGSRKTRIKNKPGFGRTPYKLKWNLVY